MKKIYSVVLIIILLHSFSFAEEKNSSNNPPIYIAFLWHMHQPIYWPYENLVQTDLLNRFPFSVVDIHNQRLGPYNSWPKDAVQKGIDANLPHLGAQVSFSGSLVENLNNLEQAGNGNFNNWKSHWNYIKNQNTSLGNPRMDMVGFGYHHPLMGLIDGDDIRRQIQAHKNIFAQNFPGTYSKGIFPPENAFTNRMIPALKSEGIDWALIDNVHFERACNGYPFDLGGNLWEPNESDIVNPDPNDWVQLNGLWAPTKVSARWSRQPRYVEYIDPATGQSVKMIAVPADRYLGNEDGRGGFGALQYEAVMSQLESYNTDPAHPILIVLAHDGDNYGGGSESYYGSNFQNFVNWLQSNPSRFIGTTIEDYLEMFPPDPNDIIHVEPGSWSGADNGDPEFKKWLGDPGQGGYSADRHSWSVITAAKNFVQTAESINPGSINTKEARRFYMNAQASDYWYWDGSLNGIWDSNPARACNYAFPLAQSVISGGTDLVGPSIFDPQREPYNPGAKEWNIVMSSDFEVWTYVYDLSTVETVKLKYRIDEDGLNDPTTTINETYVGGTGVGSWQEIVMTKTTEISQTDPQPLHKADRYHAMITGIKSKLVDYYIEAVDGESNVTKSWIKHVWVGDGSGSGTGGDQTVTWIPEEPENDDIITITVTNALIGGKLHWGVNGWQSPAQVYWPEGSELWNGSGPSLESPFTGPDTAGTLTLQIGPFNNDVQTVSEINFVIHFNDNTWNNNNGQDFLIELPDSGTATTFVLDGNLDPGVELLVSNNGVSLYAKYSAPLLYLATESAQQSGGDKFLFVSDDKSAMGIAPWGKAGQVVNWDAFIGNESTNNWSGWFDQTSGASAIAGAFLEGTINLGAELGSVPDKIFIWAAKYQTADGGALSAQAPEGNGDGNIDPSEVFEYSTGTTVQLTRNILFNEGWNLVSVPLAVADFSVMTLFPDAVSNAFTFDNGYISADTMVTAKGYWLKFNSSGISPITGNSPGSNLIPVTSGWNLIGPFENAIQVSQITSNPPGIISSSFFGYQNGYANADNIEPGKGYWVKANSAGNLVIGASAKSVSKDKAILSASEKISITIADARGKNSTLFISNANIPAGFDELPPLPPSDIFDIRFSGNKFIVRESSEIEEILIQGMTLPLSIKIGGGNIRVYDGNSVEGYLLADGNTYILKNLQGNTLKIQSANIPAGYSLGQNYPNPFNPSTKISFGLPADSKVTLKIYNSIGQEVAELLNSNFSAGTHEIIFDTAAYGVLTSGVYFYTIEAESHTGGMFRNVRKMILLR
ncbi:MAG: T9SS type A sorting domain-containing protein [Ignavibacteriales bacterium]|nr:T9SS type A sorting domain-containing protein [Ignavibacteriales bacterium]MCF8316127.1 T9SS type A sorting domain-containing protein [Ignavibacteriales bacterium]MCF8436629.1 T9SS type A sorting domain-containing protein [Ignavibacteriales bacterium]